MQANINQLNPFAIYLSANANKYNNCNNWMPRSHTQQNTNKRKKRMSWFFLLRNEGLRDSQGISVDASTVSRDIHYLTGESQNYLSS
jgi:hypothetical protein